MNKGSFSFEVQCTINTLVKWYNRYMYAYLDNNHASENRGVNRA